MNVLDDESTLDMNQVIIAGSTGYLGSHLVRILQNRNMAFKAVARNEHKLFEMGLDMDQIIKAEVTQPDTLKGKFVGADTLISTVGITRQKDGLTYMDVDYQANMNLLQEAKEAGVKKFIYVSVLNGEHYRHLKIVEAKERFVDALKNSGMQYVIIRPSGFFSDMKDFLEMAKGGRVYLFGDGNYKLNPIHGQDLARVIIDHAGQVNTEIEVGGPDILTQNEIGKLALQALGKQNKIVHLPDWVRKLIIGLLRTFTSVITYGPPEFFLTLMGQDNLAPRFGVNRLQTFFEKEADTIQ